MIGITVEGKVFHIIDNMGPGGAQRIVETILRNNPSHEAHATRSIDNLMGNPKHYSVTNSRSRFNLRSLIDCWKLLRKYDPEIVHCHLIKSKMIGILLKTLSRRDFTLVMHEHGQIWKDGGLYPAILNYSSDLVGAHIAVSEHTAKLLRQNAEIPEEKIEVIYNFVDRKEYNPEILEKFEPGLKEEASDDSFTVGFAGRFKERKGWKTVVSAAEKTDDMEFLLAGSEKRDKTSDQLENLKYLGFLEDVRTLLANIDCFVLPSHWDPSPMILYEVQSCGIPLICTNVHSINELVEDKENALMFPARDEDKLLEKLDEIKNNESLRDKLVKKGISNSKNYSYNKFQKLLNQTYSKLS